MRPGIALLIAFNLLLFVRAASGQNLVPNPSFEDTLYCPPGVNNLEAANGWLNFGNSPDYWNECGSSSAGIPQLSFGYQYAHSGKGMAAIALYRRPNAPSGPNYREFVGTKLQQPLISGLRYYFSFYINYSCQLPIAVACNKMGLRFSTIAFDSCCSPPINNWAHFYSDSIFTDSVAWVLLSGSFIADSGYKYLVLGNFFDDNNTDTLRIGTFPDYSYYYIDDVCVTTDSLYNVTWTSLKEDPSALEILVYPNPAFNTLHFKKPVTVLSYFIVDMSGRLVSSIKFNKNTLISNIDIKQLSEGYYSIILTGSNTLVRQQFVKY